MDVQTPVSRSTTAAPCPQPGFAGEKGRYMSEFSAEYMDYLDAFVLDDLNYVPNRMLRQLRLLEEIVEGMEVDQLQHSLQTATRAERARASTDIVLAALLHDVGKTISNANHPAVAAEMVRPWLGEDAYWVIRVHQDFQGIHYFERMGLDPMMRRKHTEHPLYELAEQFVDDWDNKAFDPGYDTYPLEHFVPMVEEVFSRPPRRGE